LAYFKEEVLRARERSAGRGEEAGAYVASVLSFEHCYHLQGEPGPDPKADAHSLGEFPRPEAGAHDLLYLVRSQNLSESNEGLVDHLYRLIQKYAYDD